jgi:hypothetical protein
MEVRQILEEIFELTNVPIRDLEHWFCPDATGLRNCENNMRLFLLKVRVIPFFVASYFCTVPHYSL